MPACGSCVHAVAVSRLASRAFVLLLAAGLLGATGCSKPVTQNEPVVTVATAAVQRGAISRIITTDSVLYPLKQAAISPKINAPVKQFYVTRGSRVHAGQLLAVLENTDLAAAVAENQGVYQQAEAAYATTTAATVPEELQKAEQDARLAKETLNAQQKLYESRKALYQQGAMPRKDVDQAEVAFVQARGQYEIATAHLKALKSVVHRQEIKSAVGLLSTARGKYQGASAQLAYSQIRSPIDGVVTDRPAFPGEAATSGSPLITVMDVSKVIARAHIPQAESAQLRAGDAATLIVPGVEQPITGRVTLISPALDPNSTTVEVWVQAENSQHLLKPGTTVKVKMVALTVRDALIIPRTALLTAADGQTSVMTVESDGKAHSHEVTTGIQQDESVQVVSGLREGQQVIRTGAFGLADSTRVRVEEAPAAGSGEAGKSQAAPAKDAGGKPAAK